MNKRTIAKAAQIIGLILTLSLFAAQPMIKGSSFTQALVLEEDVQIESGAETSNSEYSSLQPEESQLEEYPPQPEPEVQPEAEAEQSLDIAPQQSEYAIMRALTLEDLQATGGTVAYTFAELKTALSTNNGITTVYLGNDIVVQAGGIAIHTSKTSVTVDGTNPLVADGKRYTITDYASATQSDCIGVFSNTGTKQLLVRNINLVGKNYYGTFTVADVARDVTTTYENVTYRGPQLLHNRYGIVLFLGTTSFTTQNNGGSAIQEVGEINRLIIGGDATFTHTTSGLPCFWFTNTNPYFEILPDANVTIAVTASYLFYSDAGTPNFTVGSNAVVNIDTLHGLCYTIYANLQEFDNVQINSGATVNITQSERSPRAVATIRAKGNFTVEEKAKLSIIALNATADPLIQFSTTGSKLTFRDPERVFLYNRGAKVIDWYSGFNGQVLADVGNIRYWRTAPASPTAESVNSTPPMYTWTKMNGSLMSITAAVSNTATTSVTSNFDAQADTGVAPSTTTFNVQLARMLVLSSNLTLTVNPLTTDSTAITGNTAARALVQAEYAQAGTTKTLTANADESGNFDLPIPEPDVLEALSEVTVRSSLDSQSIEIKVQVTAGIPQILRFVHVPPTLDFQRTRITANKALIQRQEPSWAIVISDTRRFGQPWSLYASVSQPLHCTSGKTHTIPDAVIFVDSDQVSHVLGNDAVKVFGGTKNENTETMLFWQAHQGILLDLNNTAAYADRSYSTTITWTLLDAP